MKIREVKFKNLIDDYPIIIGANAINLLPTKIKLICPKARKIALIFDKNVPKKFKSVLKKKLRNYELFFFSFTANEKSKSLVTVNYYLEKLLDNNLNRNDIIISVGGGITGDIVGFVSSIYKRGINFINLPTTLLAQVDASIGGKTGVNSKLGKNLIGSFYQPKLVISDTKFLNSLSKREIICGFAEILKHAIIKDKNFFDWLNINSEKIFEKKINEMNYAVKRSCEIKLYYVNKDVNEKGLRMKLNFGHTFAHAIEIKNNYSKNITHGEAVLSGMILATKLSRIKKVCDKKTLDQIIEIYKKNSLEYTYEKYSNYKMINSLIPYLENDKKNNDDKINFILLKKIGKTTKPNMHKISTKNLKKISKSISLC